jgi:integrase
MGLGSAHSKTLADARAAANAARTILDGGLDPLAQAESQPKKTPIAAVLPRTTFREAAKRYIDNQKAEWRNAKHADQWTSTLERLAYPTIGDLDVRSIDRSHIQAILAPIWSEMPETASRLLGRIKRVLDASKVLGEREGDNPATWAGGMATLLPKKSKIRPTVHHPAMPREQISEFIAQLRTRPANSARALEFLILTASRTGEVLGVSWDEIDLAGCVWTIPGSRMKAGKAHRAALCARALEILEDQHKLTGGTGHVFRGQNGKDPLSNMSMLALLVRMGHDNLTVHGFRSTFRIWAAECTNYPREICESALAHSNRDRVEAAYLRTDHLEKRKALMADWQKYCDTPAPGPAVVVPIRRVVGE